jgi:predicted negative regulator of RcsB-dependent stress response
MVSVIIIVAIVGVAAWIVWKRRSRWQTSRELSASEDVRPETLAFEAFTHGNTHLAEGKFDDAIAAFQRARELDPKRPHVADRLAEVERRQQAALAAVPASTPS